MADNPQLQQLLQQAVNRQAYQNPLFEAVSQMAFQGLPTYATKGAQLSGSLGNQPPAAQSGGGMNPLLAAGLGAAGMGAANALTGGNALGALIDGLKKMFGKGGQPGGVQGDQPFSGGALTGPNTLFSGYDQTPPASWNSHLPWEQPFLPSDPGFFTGTTYPNDPSGGSGIGPGMQQYYGKPSQSGGDTFNLPPEWWGNE